MSYVSPWGQEVIRALLERPHSRRELQLRAGKFVPAGKAIRMTERMRSEKRRNKGFTGTGHQNAAKDPVDVGRTALVSKLVSDYLRHGMVVEENGVLRLQAEVVEEVRVTKVN